MYTYNKLYVCGTRNVFKGNKTVMFNDKQFVRLKKISKRLQVAFFTHISAKENRLHSHA